MKIFVYVEEPSDVMALEALFRCYKQKLRQQRHRLSFIDLDNKSKLLAEIGPRAAANLAESDDGRVVALPDLYPNHHDTLEQLAARLRALVRDALRVTFGVRATALNAMMSRFYPSALKHDLEMLLLVAWRLLEKHIGKTIGDSGWRHPAEGQNQQHPPKRVVEGLFHDNAGREYRDTKDAPAVLRRVTKIATDLLYKRHGQLQCPVFKDFLDWLGQQTDIPAY